MAVNGDRRSNPTTTHARTSATRARRFAVHAHTPARAVDNVSHRDTQTTQEVTTMARTTKSKSTTTSKARTTTTTDDTETKENTVKARNAKTTTTTSDTKVPKGKKRCTKSGKVLPATPEFFYRDKSQKDGLSPWSKEAERAYNKAYRVGLTAAKTPRKKDIDTSNRTGKTRLTKFEKAMESERVARGRAAKKAQA